PAALQLDGLHHLLGILAALAFIVLAGACINTAISLTARAASRRYEIALAAMLGASKRRLTRDFLRDATVLALFGSAAGLLVGLALAAYLHRAWPGSISADRAVIQPTIALAVLVLPLITVFAFSLAPRVRMARAGWIGDALAPDARKNPGVGPSDLRNLLVIVQFALALVLFICGGLLLKSSASLRSQATTSAHLDGLYSADIDASRLSEPARAQSFARALRTVAQLPGVQAESLSSRGAIFGIGTLDRVLVHCGRCLFGNMFMPIIAINVQHHAIARGYFDTLGVKLRE